MAGEILVEDTHPCPMKVYEFDGPDDPRWPKFLATGIFEDEKES